MDEMEDKLSAILSNPQMMQSIMSMAQSLGSSNPEPVKKEERSKKSEPSGPPSLPMADPELLQRIYGIARQSGIDKNQQNLLKALTPYLSRDRLSKLEKAMRAAKIAGLASTALGSGGLSLFTGR